MRCVPILLGLALLGAAPPGRPLYLERPLTTNTAPSPPATGETPIVDKGLSGGLVT